MAILEMLGFGTEGWGGVLLLACEDALELGL